MKLVNGVGALALGLLAVALASCVSIADDDYPHDWSPVLAGNKACPDLSGSYVNSGRGVPRVLLAKWILPKTTAPLEGIERIQLAGPTNGGLTIQLTQNPSTTVAVREWKEGSDYRCERGWLVLQLEGIVIPPFGYFKGAKFARTVDGELVVESNQSGFGLSPYALVPVAHHDSQWYLYPLIAK
jgi:hypothetical protein